jgi:GNAT superfamily N-acetyltransferase
MKMNVPESSDAVHMVLKSLVDVRKCPLPWGFRTRSLGPKDIDLWVGIWHDVGDVQVDADTFRQSFGEDWSVISERCFFLEDENGEVVGCASAWFNNNYCGESCGRVHWVAIRKKWQGRGLSKAMLSFTLQKLAVWHSWCYLTTEWYRQAAVRLYQKFGFEPVLDDPVLARNWARVGEPRD